MSYDVYFAVSDEEYSRVNKDGLKQGYLLRQYGGRFTDMATANEDARKLAERTGEGYVLKVSVSGHYKRNIQFQNMEHRPTVPVYDPSVLEGSL